MATEEQVEKIRESIGRVLQFEEKNMIRRPEWGTITFEEAETDINRIYTILNYLKVLPIEYLTEKAANTVLTVTDAVFQPFEQIDSFSIEQQNAPNARNSIVQQIHEVEERLYDKASPWIPFLAYQRGDVEQNISRLNRTIEEASDVLSDAKIEARQSSEEIKKIITTAREASASAGAAVFTRDFQDESEKLQNRAKKWLKATATFAVLTLAFAIVSGFLLKDPGNANVWQRLGSRVLTLSIMLTATMWSGRVYKALMHQAAVSKNKALGLKTFQAFSAAASDDATKNAVLLETTRSIFSSSITGYVDTRAPSSESDARWIEIARCMSDRE